MMIPTPFSSEAPPTGSQMFQPFPPVASSFWQTKHVSEQLRKLQDTIDLLKAVRAELDAISLIKEFDCPCEKEENTSLSSQKEENLLSFGDAYRCSKIDQSLVYELFKVIEAKKIVVNDQESLSYETANSSSFDSITCETSSWEEMSMAVKLAYKIQKSKRSKRWQRNKRKHVATARMLQQVGLSHITVLFGLPLRYSYGCYTYSLCYCLSLSMDEQALSFVSDSVGA